jgi:hypothetical protein
MILLAANSSAQSLEEQVAALNQRIQALERAMDNAHLDIDDRFVKESLIAPGPGLSPDPKAMKAKEADIAMIASIASSATHAEVANVAYSATQAQDATSATSLGHGAVLVGDNGNVGIGIPEVGASYKLDVGGSMLIRGPSFTSLEAYQLAPDRAFPLDNPIVAYPSCVRIYQYAEDPGTPMDWLFGGTDGRRMVRTFLVSLRAQGGDGSRCSVHTWILWMGPGGDINKYKDHFSYKTHEDATEFSISRIGPNLEYVRFIPNNNNGRDRTLFVQEW